MADKIIATNRQAHYNYTILETVEAGLVLSGTEVKSLRTGQANLKDSFARAEGNEIFIYNMHIAPYEFGNMANLDPLRPRKLLLHKNQIKRLIAELSLKHLALIPLRLYFKNGIAKVELAVAKGKKLYDKRESIRRRETEREIRRQQYRG
ncbi:MAG: SsrA-binding protein [Omnitrophica bacterium RIFCSPLOWO2_01_FULL_45_10]|nr:MAG: SsrA-binding protein [Omnitrophica bacterium RIFCSPLOWO2_01_FULL_45_10]